MTSKSWPVWVAGAALLALLLASGAWLVRDSAWTAKARFQRLREGMAAQEVVSIMGEPTDENPDQVVFFTTPDGLREDRMHCMSWSRQRFFVVAHFDRTGRLAYWSFSDKDYLGFGP